MLRFASNAAGLCLAAMSLCQEPRTGPAYSDLPPPTGPRIVLTGGHVVAGSDHAVVQGTITLDDLPAPEDVARAMRPAFTLAVLGAEPVSGAPAWRSVVLTGTEELGALPVAGPGTPDALVLRDVKQPGAERDGAFVFRPDGSFTYTFRQALPADVAADATLRAGVWLEGVEGTARTTSTFDFPRVAGGTVRTRELVDDALCAACHGAVEAHDGSRHGTRICVTCHTYQHADSHTVDPAAPMAATAATNPNSLDLGRFLHRVHRGRRLPTLYESTTARANPAPAFPPVFPPPEGTALALPFAPSSRNVALLNQKFRVIGEHGRERIYGKIVARTDNGQAPRTVVAGINFPQDYRNCESCHPPATRPVLDGEISRRSCHGCHPDVWFESTPPDVVHFAHHGGPQADDSRCAECHVTTAERPSVVAPLAEIHVAPLRSPRMNFPVLRLVSVTDLRPGQSPTIVFQVTDRVGPLDRLDSPTPARESGPTASPVPRKMQSVRVTIGGPASPDYSSRTVDGLAIPFTESIPLTLVPVNGYYTHTLTNKVPPSASGVWSVSLEGYRSSSTTLYDAALGRLMWPYTGESVREIADNVVGYVDTAVGTGPVASLARRTVTPTEKCAACHYRIAFHGGGARNSMEFCVVCHAPDRTDWRSRPKLADGKTVNLAATFDAVEERSTHMKLLVHRIHAGGHTGPASLDHTKPMIVYGNGQAPRFYDENEYPNDLGNCYVCHVDGTMRLEDLPKDAAPTTANETGTIRHAGTFDHTAGEPVLLPQTATCIGCHGSAASVEHYRRYTTDARENCIPCHGSGRSLPVDVVHRLEPSAHE